jgi:hypothetical protein
MILGEMMWKMAIWFGLNKLFLCSKHTHIIFSRIRSIELKRLMPERNCTVVLRLDAASRQQEQLKESFFSQIKFGSAWFFKSWNQFQRANSNFKVVLCNRGQKKILKNNSQGCNFPNKMFVQFWNKFRAQWISECSWLTLVCTGAL